MTDSERALGDLLLDRLATADLPGRIPNLVLAAFTGDALDETPAEPAELAPTAPEIAVPEMFLRRISVRGFRGIGPAAVLDLAPGPGLTVVSGRNGSGKSSFAEAAELALTGQNQRWNGKQHSAALWQEGWRNFHGDGTVELAVELVIAGDDKPTAVRMTWPNDRALAKPDWTIQRHGSPRETVESARWARELELYRPFLSYDELGAVFTVPPSQFHDHLHKLLGLGALDDALVRLRDARLSRERQAKDLKTAAKELCAELADVDDPRARRAEELLRSRHHDLDAIAVLALHADDTAETARLGALLAIEAPTAVAVGAAVDQVRAALDRRQRVHTEQAAAADLTANLLAQALNLHEQHGDQACPVCREGRLDTAWRTDAAAELHRTRELANEVRDARIAVTTAVGGLTDLIVAVPGRLRDDPDPAITALAEIWNEWAALRTSTDHVALADRASGVHARLEAALADVRETAHKAMTRLDEQWRPAAAKLMVWHRQAVHVRGETELLGELKRAENWLKEASTELRDTRMAPIAARAQSIWQNMRQQSDVRLDRVKLTGTTMTRKVALEVSIDNATTAANTNAISVMSQGELHTLGLALFLPRATMDASPFRFVVIDDPVQAMDPGKVQGLAEVLADVARTRQVIVFSHDDRLAEAVRRLPDPPTMWEVQRKSRSSVDVVRSADPIDRYVQDARALASTDQMPGDLCRELVANCCRGMLEVAAQRKIRATRLSRGESLTDVEKAIAEAQTTHVILTLAVFDTLARSGDLYGRLNNALGGWAVDVVKQCKFGAHLGLTGDLHRVINDTQRLARWVEQ